jgi:protein TonB
MNAILYSLNIGTLATWLSVTGFGTVAGLIPVWHPEPQKAQLLDALPVSHDFTLGDEESGSPSPLPAPAPDAGSPASELPAPPELPELAESAPLPEIPSLPPAAESAAPSMVSPKPVARPQGPANPGKPVATRSTPRSGNGAVGSASGGSVNSSGSANLMSNAARLAAGRMRPPNYPSHARLNNQTGTVLVEFTVDASGKVISAYAKSSSSWPLLDNEAVRTVRSWKFPPGGIMKLQRPIVFRLN